MIYNNNAIAFDIETEALDPNTILERTKPHPEFDPASVKLGDCCTPEARSEKLARAEADYKKKEESYYARAVERGALAAETGRVLTIAYLPVETDEAFVDFDHDEERLLRRFWAEYSRVKKMGGQLVGHNVVGFDLPFLLRRSWANHIAVPEQILNGRSLSPLFLDTMQVWAAGEFKRFIALDLLGEILGVGGKSDQEVCGADFARFWRAGGAKQELARAYAERDVFLVRDIYRIICGQFESATA